MFLSGSVVSFHERPILFSLFLSLFFSLLIFSLFRSFSSHSVDLCLFFASTATVVGELGGLVLRARRLFELYARSLGSGASTLVHSRQQRTAREVFTQALVVGIITILDMSFQQCFFEPHSQSRS